MNKTGVEAGRGGAHLESQHSEAEAGGSLGVLGKPALHSKFQDSQGYTVKTLFQTTKTQQNIGMDFILRVNNKTILNRQGLRRLQQTHSLGILCLENQECILRMSNQQEKLFSLDFL